MNDILNAATRLLISMTMLIAALAVVPLLLKILIPALGEQAWRAYWRTVRWTFLIPFRLLAARARETARRR